MKAWTTTRMNIERMKAWTTTRMNIEWMKAWTTTRMNIEWMKAEELQKWINERMNKWKHEWKDESMNKWSNLSNVKAELTLWVLSLSLRLAEDLSKQKQIKKLVFWIYLPQGFQESPNYGNYKVLDCDCLFGCENGLTGRAYMPSPLAPDPIRVQPCVWCLFWTNSNCVEVTSIFLSSSLSN